MRPAFSLDAILNLREHREQAEERALSALAVQRQQIEATLTRISRELQQWSEEMTRAVRAVATGTFHHTNYARLQMLKDLQTQLREQLRSVDAQRRQQQIAYLEARRSREMLTQLKAEQQYAYERAEQRQEQRRIEDAFLSRFRSNSAATQGRFD